MGRRLLQVGRTIYGPAEGPQPGAWIAWAPDMRLDAVPGCEAFAGLPVAAVIDDPALTVAAIRAGLGLSVLPYFVGDAAPDLRRSARVRALSDALAAVPKENRALFEGGAAPGDQSARNA